MTIVSNHTIVPARDKHEAARWFAQIMGLRADELNGHFAPVRVNDTLTLLFADEASFDQRHYAFHVSDAEFDSHPRSSSKREGAGFWKCSLSLDDGKLNDWNAGRGVRAFGVPTAIYLN